MSSLHRSTGTSRPDKSRPGRKRTSDPSIRSRRSSSRQSLCYGSGRRSFLAQSGTGIYTCRLVGHVSCIVLTPGRSTQCNNPCLCYKPLQPSNNQLRRRSIERWRCLLTLLLPVVAKLRGGCELASAPLSSPSGRRPLRSCDPAMREAASSGCAYIRLKHNIY